MLRAGARAPEFTLPDQDGRTVSLAALLTGRGLLLYFYPADFTPGCTREACAIRDIHAEIAQSGMVAVGVSPQTPEVHRAFREKCRLPQPLLADVDRSVARLYGVLGPFGLGIRRATFQIAGDRTIVAAVRADLRIGRHEAFIREAAQRSAREGGARSA